MMESGDVGRISVGDEVKGLIFMQSASRFIHRHGGGQRIALGRDMVSGDLMRVGIQKQEREVMLTRNADVSFIADSGRADCGFMAQVELMTVIGGGLGVVQDGLVADLHTEDLAEHLCGFASRQGKRDVKSKNQSEDIRRAVNAGQIDGKTFRRGRSQLGRAEMILAILITQLELRQAQLLKQAFVPLQSRLLLQVMRTVIAGDL